jgi:hypothetical protein
MAENAAGVSACARWLAQRGIRSPTPFPDPATFILVTAIVCDLSTFALILLAVPTPFSVGIGCSDCRNFANRFDRSLDRTSATNQSRADGDA